jgi:REP element-mobilizing transposase RayT
MTFVRKSKLPRLRREFYLGHAIVLWTHTLEDRATGWLCEPFHSRFREILLHACARYHLACPCYVLMPDHWHLVWIGLDETSDQRLAKAFLRKHTASLLGAARLQDRAHEHVLREDQRERGAFQSACEYVLANPERAGLCTRWSDWPYLGAIFPGYPRLDPRDSQFWEDFWKLHNLIVENHSVPALPRRATTDQSECSPLRKERDSV